MNSKLKPYIPRSPHGTRPDGLGPTIRGLPVPDVIENIIGVLVLNFIACKSLWLFHLHNMCWRDVPQHDASPDPAVPHKQTRERDRDLVFCNSVLKVASAMLDYCQPGANGVIGVPAGSEILPMTKNTRADCTGETDKDYMHGLAKNAGVSRTTVHKVLKFFVDMGLAQHDGYEEWENRRSVSIRISVYAFEEPARLWLFMMTGRSKFSRDRHTVATAKATKKRAMEREKADIDPRSRIPYRPSVRPDATKYAEISAKIRAENPHLPALEIGRRTTEIMKIPQGP